MSRKFTIGRQNDLLLNEKMHELYTHLEFISYKDGDGNLITSPRQTKQTEIPVGALWLQHPLDTNMHKLRVHTDPTATSVEDKWPCLFEGYYHPAGIKTDNYPENPAQGQIWIDDKNILYVCDMSSGIPKWEPVATKQVIEEHSGYFVGMNYQAIDPLLPLSMSGEYEGDPIYSVPFESFGKLYVAKEHADEYQYCHPPVNALLKTTPYYDMQGNEGAISITDDATELYKAKRWTHVNPYDLNKITKRFIAIDKPKAYYRKIENHLKLPKFHDLDDEVQLIPMSDEEIPGDDYDSEMNVEPLDPNPIPGEDFDSEMNVSVSSIQTYIGKCIIEKVDEVGNITKVVYVDKDNVIIDVKSMYDIMPIAEGDEDILDDNYDSEMNVEAKDPNPIPDDDFDSGMNEDSYKEIPDESYDSDMNVDIDYELLFKEMGLTEIIIYEVVPDNISIRDIDPAHKVRAKVANQSKYYKSTEDFYPGEYVQLMVVEDTAAGFIHVPDGNASTTEFFAFKSSAFSAFDDYDNKIGRLLKYYSSKEGIIDESMGEDEEYKQNLNLRNDYKIVNGGIQLSDRIISQYDYIYAITYEFKPQHDKDGELIRITKTSLEGPDQIYIGACAGTPVVFMDGLYLDHYDDLNNEVYTYDEENITFAGNDVLDEMQILVVSFPKVNSYVDARDMEHPIEYNISEHYIRRRFDVCDKSHEEAIRVVETSDASDETSMSYAEVVAHTPDLKGVIDASGNFYVCQSDIRDVVIQGGKADSLFDKENFPNPLIFYNGLAGYTYATFPKEYVEEGEIDIHIDYEDKYLTIHNFGSIIDANGTSSIFAVSLGENNYKNSGILKDGVIYDEKITSDKPYLVIVDGIVMSPFNDDITVEDGKITITDAYIALNSEYTIIELTDKNDDSLIDDTDAIICIYDDMFAPYSIPLMNKSSINSSNAYDDCDSAIVMCGPGVLVDREAFQQDFNPDAAYVGGQIVKVRLKTTDGKELYEWRQYTHSNAYTVLDPIYDGHIIRDCERMTTYHMNNGTVLLNPVNIDDQPVTVYAYMYVDHIDERLLRGQRLIEINVPSPGEPQDGDIKYGTNRTHLYDVGKESLSIYINGIMTHFEEEPTVSKKGDTFFVDKQFANCFNNGETAYIYEAIMAIDDDTNLDTIIEVNNDECLALKYFASEHQLTQAKALRKYILNDMKNNQLMYFIENVESNEFAACRREWNAPRTDNGNLPNSYMTTMRLMPGIINVYVNGVLLDKNDYAVYDNNKIMIGFDLVGGQEHVKAIKDQYDHPYRVMTEEGFKYIECESDDEVLIEVRDDLTLKKRSYVIEDVSYETGVFDTLDYDFPNSLCSTRDVIKIYINGVLYDGDYTNNNGVITLLEHVLDEDPLYAYLKTNLSAMEEYKNKYGDYARHEDIITFEWR